ncbi:MAG: signal peptidase II [Proteobacteria bacterium]|nr:MAG: signal peptidase II [Pseudomonadota bacterium]
MILLVAVTSLTVAVFDQISKWIILQYFQEGQILPVIPEIFNLTLHYNKGVAFGMLADLPDGQRQILMTVTTMVALGFVAYLLIKQYLYDSVGQFSLALILGGAAGNIIDRARLGQVVDFLDFYYSTYHWPAFNLADSSICVGVFLLIVRRPKDFHADESQ